MVSPRVVESPKSQIKLIRVLYDGSLGVPPNNLEFSIAELEIKHTGKFVYGIRHDTSDWNPNKPNNGYPTSRGNPCWFILPDMGLLLPKLNEIFGVCNKTPHMEDM